MFDSIIMLCKMCVRNFQDYNIHYCYHNVPISNRSTLAVVFDYCLLTLGVLLSFSVGIVLSVGLSYTCDKMEKEYNYLKYVYAV